MQIKRINLKRIGIRFILVPVLGGLLLGLYLAFKRAEEKRTPPSAQEPLPLPAATPATKPAPEVHAEHGLKLQLSTSPLAVNVPPPARTTAPSLRLSTETSSPVPRQALPLAATEPRLALDMSTRLTPFPPGKTQQSPLATGQSAPLKLAATKQIAPRSASAESTPRARTNEPLRLAASEQLANLPAIEKLALDATQTLSAARPSPSAPQPGEPLPRSKEPALPAPERNTPRRGATLAQNKGVKEDTTWKSPTLSAFGWSIPPIKYSWGGQVGVETGRTYSEGSQSSTISEFINLNGSASSYIYAPWLARVNGNLSLSATNSKSTGSAQTSDSLSVTGGGMLNIFPASRFPSIVTYDVTDTSSSSGQSNHDRRQTRFGIRQTYQPQSGDYRVFGAFNSNTNHAADGSDTVNTLTGNFTRNFGDQQLNVDGGYSQSYGSSSGQESELFNLSASHAYQILDNLQLNSNAGFSDNTQTFLSDAALAKNRGRSINFGTHASWHPEEDEEGYVMPLNVSGGIDANLFENQSSTSQNQNKFQNIRSNVAASYNYSRNLTLRGDTQISQVSNDTSSQVLTLIGAGATYSGDPRNIGAFAYNWNAGVNGTQQSGGGINNLSIIENFGHTLSRAMKLSASSNMSLSLGQSMAHSSNSQTGNTASISHNAGASYNKTFSENTQGILGLQFSDSIGTGANPSHFTNLDLTAQGNTKLNLHSTANIDMNLRHMVTNTGSQDGTNNHSVTTNLSGSAFYQHQRAFGIPRLRYNASLNANTALRSDAERLAGNVGSINDDVTYAFENRLDYRIGLLDFELRGTLNSTAGQRNASIFFRAFRSF